MVERPGLAFADVNFSCKAGNPTLSFAPSPRRNHSQSRCATIKKMK